MTSSSRLGLYVGVPLGIVFLALVVGLAVLLPKAEGSTAVSLPVSLPGGYTALDTDRPLPADAQLPDDYLQTQQSVVKSIQSDYDDVYEEPVAFRAYANDDLSVFAIVTVFSGDGGAYGPDFGTSENLKLVREGDAVCTASYQTQGADGQPAQPGPASVTCQLSAHEHTVQVATSALSIAATAKLADEVSADL